MAISELVEVTPMAWGCHGNWQDPYHERYHRKRISK